METKPALQKRTRFIFNQTIPARTPPIPNIKGSIVYFATVEIDDQTHDMSCSKSKRYIVT